MNPPRMPAQPSSRIAPALLLLAISIALAARAPAQAPARAQSPGAAYPLFEIEAADALGVVREASGIAVTPAGTIFVVDRLGDRIQRFASDGTPLALWGDTGSAPGQFRGPKAIAVGADETVYVADTGNHRIQRFDAWGRFLGEWGAVGSGAGALDSPEGVAVGSDGVVYVSDTAGHVIQRYSPEGVHLGSFGNTGPEADRLDRPRQLAMGPQGHVYAIDFGHDRIHAYAPDGTLVRQLRWSDQIDLSREDLFYSAISVAPDGTLYAAHSLRIQHFNLAGRMTGELDLGRRSISLAVAGADRLLAGIAPFWTFSIADLDVSERPEYRYIIPERNIGRPSQAIAQGQFSQREGFYPPRVALSVAPNGRLYAIDFLGGRMQWFRSDGLFLGEIFGFKLNHGRLGEGLSVAAAPDGTIWVANAGAARLEHLDAEGRDLEMLDLAGPGRADGVAVAPDGSLFVADASKGRIQHLSVSGTLIDAWGGDQGSDEGEFGYCLDYDVFGVECNSQPIALSPNGSIVYLLDSGNGRVHRYTAAGEALGSFGGLTAEGEIQRSSQGIAVAPDGTILVSNTAAREVIRFAPDGSILERIAGAEGKARGRFDRPGTLAVAEDGSWFVSDREHGRVLAFGATPRDSWRGEYFGNPWLVEQPLAIAESAEIDFDWGNAAPDPALEAAGWSARFERSLKLAPGAHTFGLQTQGGARLWIGEELAVDAWDLREISRSGDFEVPAAGEVFVRLEFRDPGGPASLRLLFDGAPVPTETPEPTVIATETPGSPATATRPAPVTWTLYFPLAER